MGDEIPAQITITQDHTKVPTKCYENLEMSDRPCLQCGVEKGERRAVGSKGCNFVSELSPEG